MQCRVTPEMFWNFRRSQLGGKSAVPPHSPLPKELEDCNPDVQADHYSQACYALASYEVALRFTELPGPEILVGVPRPRGVSEERAKEIRYAAYAQMLTDHGIA